MKTLVVVAVLALILYHLGAGLWFMLVDQGQTRRTVRSLTWRIGLSVALIGLVALGIATGVVAPHGVGR